MQTKTLSSTKRALRATHIGALGIVSVLASFVIGIRTASDVHPVSTTVAGSVLEVPLPSGGTARGDLDRDGVISVKDAIVVLEALAGYRTMSREQLIGCDGKASLDCALRILRTVHLR
jgi:hypothetical protein